MIYFDSSILSSTEHEKFCVNLRGPSRKAKYSLVTDSEPVLWRKGEKHFEQKSEIVPETMRLQAVGAEQSVTACLLHNEPTSYHLWQG